MKGLTVIVELKDYREIDLNKKFDRITSLGIFKHVCYKNYRTFLKFVPNYLKNNGFFYSRPLEKIYLLKAVTPDLINTFFLTNKYGLLPKLAKRLRIYSLWKIDIILVPIMIKL